MNFNKDLKDFNSYLLDYVWSPTEDVFNFTFVYDTSTMYANIVSPEILNLNTDSSLFFSEVYLPQYNSVLLSNLFLGDNLSLVNTLSVSTFTKNSSETIYKFFPQMQETLTDLEILFDETKDESTLEYMRTIPDGKLYYPEPFIASPSFLHEEIWFIHILHYNYWLWFFFISLIMFYFITFVHVVRWCNLRSKPKRETRGVSRSKCADLITACVPVSWALSIIISETVDATDYYDGFGTGEVVIGIRAYQWGWEYFYPKNIDLNYNVNPSYSSFIGNSIKYNNTSSEHLDSNSIWKFYQKKNKTAQVNSPAYVILSPNDTTSSQNFIDFSTVGNSISSDTNAFSKIHRLSKISSNNVTTNLSNDNLIFSKINNLYLSNNTINQDSYQYGSPRQHNYSSLNSFLPSFSTLVDTNSFKTFFNYSLNTQKKATSTISNTNFFSKHNDELFSSNKSSVNSLVGFVAPFGVNSSTYSFKKFLINFNTVSNANVTNDGKNNTNPLFSYFDKGSRKKVLSFKKPAHFSVYDDLTSTVKSNFYTWNLFNEAKNYRFIDLKSGNLQFLSPDKNLRNTLSRGVSSTNTDFDPMSNVSNLISSNNSLKANLYTNYDKSLNNWSNSNIVNKILSTNTTFSSTYNPVSSTSTSWNTLSYDKLNSYVDGDVPSIMRGKEEVAPEYLFNTYWNSYYRNISLNNNYKLILNNLENNKSMYLPSILEYSEYDFKNWQALESLEDALWESSHSSFSQEEYTTIKTDSTLSSYYDKIQALYNLNSRTQEGSKFKFKAKIAYRSLSSKLQTSNIYSLPISSEYNFTNPSDVNLINFNSLYILLI